MASRLSSLKGVRTRCRNTLNTELQKAVDLLRIPEQDTTKEDVLKMNKCAELLKKQSERLESSTEKLFQSLEEEDSEYMDGILDDNWKLICETDDVCIDLKQRREQVSENFDSQTSEEKQTMIETAQLLECKEEMHQFMLNQSKKQDLFIESQTMKDHDKASVKLPKIDLISFDGDKSKWFEFWDVYECTIHKNKKLSNIEKFSYLRTKLTGDAKRAVSGLSLSNETYDVAMNILRERFGNKQDVIDLHYRKLMSVNTPNETTTSLRFFVDFVEKHLRSLEVLGQDVNQDIFVSLIKTRLPKEVLLQLELKKNSSHKWTMHALRCQLKEYVVARERSEQTNTHMKGDKYMESKNIHHRLNQRKQFQWKKQAGYNRPGKQASTFAQALAVNSDQQRKRSKCVYCSKDHWSDECHKYSTIDARKKRLTGSCYKCLKNDHTQRNCRSNRLCIHCGLYSVHHRSLCPKKFKTVVATERVHISEEVGDNSSATEDDDEERVLVSTHETVLMQTASTRIENSKTSESCPVRLLLDSGSHRTYITEHFANKMKLKRGPVQELKLMTFGSDKAKIVRSQSTEFRLHMKNGKHMIVTANIVPCISGSVSRRPFNIKGIAELDHVIAAGDLADTSPFDGQKGTVELLIGNDYYLDIVMPQKIELQPGLYLLASKLGWIVSGRTFDTSEGDNSDSSLLIMTQGTSLTKAEICTPADKSVHKKPELEDFWNVEAIGITDDPQRKDDEIAMENFQKSLQFNNGRYHVSWPWKEEPPDLPTNYNLATGRLRSLKTKLDRQPTLRNKYDTTIKDQLAKGIIERIEKGDQGVDGVIHYIPHHAVLKPTNNTTKLRIVYDASAKTRKDSKCLNDCLYRGPVMLQDLCGILMRFRLHQTALVADIEKAFLQIGLQDSQKDCTRFLWLKDCKKPLISSNIQEYRFCRVPFGVISSPFILAATVDHHLSLFGDDVSEQIRNNIYVDNVVTGTHTSDDAIEIYTKSKSMFSKASMNLREWISNSDKVNSQIPGEDKVSCDETKILGHNWNIKRDTLSLKQTSTFENAQHTTKRTILQEIAAVFDPLGMFTPVTLPGKVLVQDLWSQKYSWDTQVDEKIRQNWSSIKDEIRAIFHHEFPRCLSLSRKSETTYSLLSFCDASKKAYATTVYLKQTDGNDSRTDLLFAKTRLAPIKEITLPRLELLAVVIGVRCLQFVKKQLQLPIQNMVLWTDAKCVLSWISTEKKLTRFVGNRVSEIKANNGIMFGHVSGKENPADIATRGCSMAVLAKHEVWWHGPSWLANPVDTWHIGINPDEESVPEFQSEVKESSMIVDEELVTETESLADGAIDISRFSSLTKLLRVTVLVSRFIDILKRKDTPKGSISNKELDMARKRWIRHIQNDQFGNGNSTSNVQRMNNMKKQLGVFVDKSGIMRCQGRLEHSELCESARKPILLPKASRFTHLMIQDCHTNNLHCGISQTLSMVRRIYWIPSGRSTVRKVLNRCQVCKRWEGGPYKMPQLSPLPKSRVTESTAFSRTGLDYMGPLYVNSEVGTRKVWVCLFTCFVTRAVHLEVVNDLSAEEFLSCLRRFVAIRGTPEEILSDNASQFKLASKVVTSIWSDIQNSDDIQTYVATKGIQWRFIVELAPWMGGFYERLVGLTKRTLRKTIGRRIITATQMHTLLKEIESVINSRPLVYVNDDINSNITLSPSMFLGLNPRIGIPMTASDPDGSYNPYESSVERLLEIWKKGQKLLNTFWKLWRDEYLTNLRERCQISLKQTRIQSHVNPNVGDVVLIKDEATRGQWKVGKITDLLKSKDGYIRSAKVMTPSGRMIGRPLNLLYPLECSCVSESVEKKCEETNNSADHKMDRNQPTKKSTRKAAHLARQRIQSQL